ncbi:hypothetical protein PoB_005193200 [Plakobranchus ocellatus]|uniref:Uncharacterized protein n=1 Tax=Plakobranchus ocellatus TaxID=259542 RepID=A0AAV4C2D2_9GAST|nr:hypothetical protein PoB_005193200 [Plakobranchus ocellatus]
MWPNKIVTKRNQEKEKEEKEEVMVVMEEEEEEKVEKQVVVEEEISKTGVNETCWIKSKLINGCLIGNKILFKKNQFFIEIKPIFYEAGLIS